MATLLSRSIKTASLCFLTALCMGLTGPVLAEATRVGLVLPLSAKNQTLRAEARGLYDAALMATFESQSTRIVLVPQDSGTTAASAMSARDNLLGQVDVIVGPLFSAQTQIFADMGMVVFSLSNDQSLASNIVYPFGPAPELEVRRLIDHACEQGLKRIMVFSPKGRLFNRLESHALDAVDACEDGRMMAVTFGRGDTALRHSAKTVAEMSATYDAVLLPTAGSRGQKVAEALVKYGLNPKETRLLGMSSMRDYSSNALRGMWIPGPDPKGRAEFEQRFLAAFGRLPTRLSALSYDAVMVAAYLGTHGGDRSVLHDDDGFTGADGAFRLREDGRVDRKLAVLQLGPTGWALHTPADTDFLVLPSPQTSAAPLPEETQEDMVQDTAPAPGQGQPPADDPTVKDTESSLFDKIFRRKRYQD